MRRSRGKSREAQRNRSSFEDEAEEVESLHRQYEKLREDHPSGSQKTTELVFEDLPLSSKTKRGLQEEGMVTTTEIQSATLPHALLQRDILGQLDYSIASIYTIHKTC